MKRIAIALGLTGALLGSAAGVAVSVTSSQVAYGTHRSQVAYGTHRSTPR